MKKQDEKKQKKMRNGRSRSLQQFVDAKKDDAVSATREPSLSMMFNNAADFAAETRSSGSSDEGHAKKGKGPFANVEDTSIDGADVESDDNEDDPFAGVADTKLDHQNKKPNQAKGTSRLLQAGVVGLVGSVTGIIGNSLMYNGVVKTLAQQDFINNQTGVVFHGVSPYGRPQSLTMVYDDDSVVRSLRGSYSREEESDAKLILDPSSTATSVNVTIGGPSDESDNLGIAPTWPTTFDTAYMNAAPLDYMPVYTPDGGNSSLYATTISIQQADGSWLPVDQNYNPDPQQSFSISNLYSEADGNTHGEISVQFADSGDFETGEFVFSSDWPTLDLTSAAQATYDVTTANITIDTNALVNIIDGVSVTGPLTVTYNGEAQPFTERDGVLSWRVTSNNNDNLDHTMIAASFVGADGEAYPLPLSWSSPEDIYTIVDQHLKDLYTAPWAEGALTALATALIYAVLQVLFLNLPKTSFGKAFSQWGQQCSLNRLFVARLLTATLFNAGGIAALVAVLKDLPSDVTHPVLLALNGTDFTMHASPSHSGASGAFEIGLPELAIVTGVADGLSALIQYCKNSRDLKHKPSGLQQNSSPWLKTLSQDIPLVLQIMLLVQCVASLGGAGWLALIPLLAQVVVYVAQMREDASIQNYWKVRGLLTDGGQPKPGLNYGTNDDGKPLQNPLGDGATISTAVGTTDGSILGLGNNSSLAQSPVRMTASGHTDDENDDEAQRDDDTPARRLSQSSTGSHGK